VLVGDGARRGTEKDSSFSGELLSPSSTSPCYFSLYSLAAQQEVGKANPQDYLGSRGTRPSFRKLEGSPELRVVRSSISPISTLSTFYTPAPFVDLLLSILRSPEILFSIQRVARKIDDGRVTRLRSLSSVFLLSLLVASSLSGRGRNPSQNLHHPSPSLLLLPLRFPPISSSSSPSPFLPRVDIDRIRISTSSLSLSASKRRNFD